VGIAFKESLVPRAVEWFTGADRGVEGFWGRIMVGRSVGSLLRDSQPQPPVYIPQRV